MVWEGKYVILTVHRVVLKAELVHGTCLNHLKSSFYKANYSSVSLLTTNYVSLYRGERLKDVNKACTIKLF